MTTEEHILVIQQEIALQEDKIRFDCAVILATGEEMDRREGYVDYLKQELLTLQKGEVKWKRK